MDCSVKIFLQQSLSAVSGTQIIYHLLLSCFFFLFNAHCESFPFFFLPQYVFRTKSFDERTVHEELSKNVTGLLKSNEQVTVKQVLKVNDSLN